MNFEKLKKSEFWKNENNLLELKNHKNEKKTKISSFYTSEPKLMIIGYTVLEIWHMTDVIVVFQFGQFFALLPPQQPKKWKFQINTTILGDIILLHNCTKTHDYMLYCSWDMVHDSCTDIIVIFHFGLFFALWPPYLPKKWKYKKNEKKHQDIMILHKCTKAHDDTLCCSWDMVRDGCNCFFFPTLGNVLPFCHLNSPKNENFKKLKNTWRFYHFTQLHQKLWLQAILFLKYGTRQM